MGNWGDNVDYELQSMKEYKGRYTPSFIKIIYDVDEIAERTMEVTDKHPRNALLKLWAGAMTGFFVLFLFSYQVLFFITVPLLAFYLIALFKIFKCWRNFKYKGLPFWLMSIGTLAVLFVIAHILRTIVLG